MPVNQQLLSDIKEYAEQYFFENSVSPSIREIAAHFNVGKSTVQRYLERLRDCGEIEYDGRRSIKTSETDKYEASCVNVGVVGDISCGRLPSLSRILPNISACLFHLLVTENFSFFVQTESQ